AAELRKDLRNRLEGKDLDTDTRLALIDALALTAAISSWPPTNAEIATLRFAMASIAWPLRDASQSPAWAKLEPISGKKCNRDIQRLLFWLQTCCKLAPSAARPPFGD